jgi:two-component sensor histidine kinase
MIVSLLSLQSRNAASPEASAQLTIAANRIAAFGRVHRRLHLLDHKDQVEFKQYLQDLCKDLSGLLCEDGASTDIVVEGSTVHLPSTFAIPLGLITNELITFGEIRQGPHHCSLGNNIAFAACAVGLG